MSSVVPPALRAYSMVVSVVMLSLYCDSEVSLVYVVAWLVSWWKRRCRMGHGSSVFHILYNLHQGIPENQGWITDIQNSERWANNYSVVHWRSAAYVSVPFRMFRLIILNGIILINSVFFPSCQSILCYMLCHSGIVVKSII